MVDNATYEGDGYILLPSVVAADVVSFLVRYFEVLRLAGRLEVDSQVPGALRLYGDPAFETLLDGCTAVVSAATGRELVPSYSFVRRYERGQELVPHRDRPSCEHSVSITLGSSSDDRWPIHMRRGAGPVASVGLDPGDGILYRGTEVMHWRDPLPGAWHLQVFLHYVDRHGPFAAEAFDGRGGLAQARPR